MCLWCGIMKIAESTILLNKFTKLLNPVLNFLFPELKNKRKVKEEIAMNMTANILGIGNAATPLGLKAMESLQEENENKEELSNSMIMLILLNTASLQIIPTTIIAIRVSLRSQNATQIIVPVWVATISAAIIGIISVKLMIIKEGRSKKNRCN